MTALKIRALAAVLEQAQTAAHLIPRQTRTQIDSYQRQNEESFKGFSTGIIVAMVLSIVIFFGIMIALIVFTIKRRNRRLASYTVTSSYVYGNNGATTTTGPGYNGPYTSIPNPTPVAPPAYSNNMYAPRGGADPAQGQQEQQHKGTRAGADPAVGMEPFRPTGQVPM
ncbi:hypothetical protein MCOR25_001262 [Pyricularia grisea]|uniref:Uncharacterized protein n=1 Tax=Pyricularia grisea TaxID=148305 RepID=A0A6P8BGM7_PYRGI|nr:uncharacterized protein PgNI_00732 [Pyricularia grisea]KAI6381330.1 hypothetical protein MCOR25_001262 [Pyricularia grisea]TLD15817.1 hypothetical protein PgNI_00732 [Pyricularia grisea]